MPYRLRGDRSNPGEKQGPDLGGDGEDGGREREREREREEGRLTHISYYKVILKNKRTKMPTDLISTTQRERPFVPALTQIY